MNIFTRTHVQRLVFASATALLFAACGRTEEPALADKPKALDKPISVSDVTKRTATDVLEDLYDGIVDSSAALQRLEKDLADFNSEWPDAPKTFNEYDSKNQSYFQSAKNLLATISDSSLKQQVDAVLKAERARYDASTASAHDKIKRLEAKSPELDDLRSSLKILLTLRIMSKYQQSNTPDTRAIDRAIQRADSLVQRLKLQMEKAK